MSADFYGAFITGCIIRGGGGGGGMDPLQLSHILDGFFLAHHVFLNLQATFTNVRQAC